MHKYRKISFILLGIFLIITSISGYLPRRNIHINDLQSLSEKQYYEQLYATKNISAYIFNYSLSLVILLCLRLLFSYIHRSTKSFNAYYKYAILILICGGLLGVCLLGDVFLAEYLDPSYRHDDARIRGVINLPYTIPFFYIPLALLFFVSFIIHKVNKTPISGNMFVKPKGWKIIFDVLVVLPAIVGFILIAFLPAPVLLVFCAFYLYLILNCRGMVYSLSS